MNKSDSIYNCDEWVKFYDNLLRYLEQNKIDKSIIKLIKSISDNHLNTQQLANNLHSQFDKIKKTNTMGKNYYIYNNLYSEN